MGLFRKSSKTSMEDLVERSESIAKLIIEWSWETLERLWRDLGECDISADSLNWLEIRRDFLFLYVHVLDRLVFGSYGSLVRDTIIDKINPIMLRYLAVNEVEIKKIAEEDTSNLSDEELKEYVFHLMDEYNSKILSWSKYDRLFVEPGEMKELTLFWGFALKVSKINGSVDMRIAIQVYSTMCEFVVMANDAIK